MLANLVLSHVPDHVATLADVVGLLRPGGRLGCTAWASAEQDLGDNQMAEADGRVGAIIETNELDLAPCVSAVPWEEHFRDSDRLHEALAAAGPVDVNVRLRTYRWSFTVDDFLVGWGSRGRYMQYLAGERRWREFRDQAASALRARFGSSIGAVNHAWIAVARRPTTHDA